MNLEGSVDDNVIDDQVIDNCSLIWEFFVLLIFQDIPAISSNYGSFIVIVIWTYKLALSSSYWVKYFFWPFLQL